jgi:hypothetical protein
VSILCVVFDPKAFEAETGGQFPGICPSLVHWLRVGQLRRALSNQGLGRQSVGRSARDRGAIG